MYLDGQSQRWGAHDPPEAAKTCNDRVVELLFLLSSSLSCGSKNEDGSEDILREPVDRSLVEQRANLS